MSDLIGKVVSWTSQTGGSTTKKTGIVLVIVPKRVSVEKVIADNKLDTFRTKAQNVNQVSDRYLIKVQSPSGKTAYYYLPPVTTKFIIEGGIKDV